MSYTHFTIIERTKIEVYLELGYSLRAIARQLNRSPSSISRELKRSPGNYQAETAQAASQERKKACGAGTKLTVSLKQVIQEKLDQTWSPEQIAGRLFEGVLTFKTIYRWLYAGQLNRSLTVLRQKGKRQQPRETRGRFNVGTPITKRPKVVQKRTTFGHWEVDTVVSGRGKAKGCVATFIERQTRWYQAILMPDRSAQSMEQAIRTLHASFPAPFFQSFTTDRGKEFSCYSTIETELEVPVYFADPYAAWQRGSNENGNGLLREFFPKGTNFEQVLPSEVERALHFMNHRPRKCLNWKTPHELFMEKCCT